MPARRNVLHAVLTCQVCVGGFRVSVLAIVRILGFATLSCIIIPTEFLWSATVISVFIFTYHGRVHYLLYCILLEREFNFLAYDGTVFLNVYF